jgi:hypothetical protein
MNFSLKIALLPLFGILVYFCVHFYRIRNSLKKLNREKERSESDLLAKLKSARAEKDGLERELEKTRSELTQNRKVIEILSTKLKAVTEDFDRLKSEYDLTKIEELYAEIRELTDRNQSLESLLENTYEKIQENTKTLGSLKNEVDTLKHPEVYIDFENKVIRHKDGSEFVYSSAARQYKNDVFRYLEYIVRNRKNRIHLIEFGLNDPRFFLEAVKQDTVREYNYKGKFAKVKSGINRTFRDNVGRDLILHDHEKIYAYCTFPDKVLRIASKEKDIDIVLSEMNRSKMPEIMTFFGYETFDYYRVNPEITIRSNIHDSTDRVRTALQAGDQAEKVKKLVEAVMLDLRNYSALERLLDHPSFQFSETIQKSRENVRGDVESLEYFLAQNPVYRRPITNIQKIKQEYREIYSWKYVNAAKSAKFKNLGEIAFRHILDHELKKMTTLLEGYRAVYRLTETWFGQFERLKSLFEFFGSIIERDVLTETLLDFLDRKESADLGGNLETGGNEIRIDFLKFLIDRQNGSIDQPPTRQTLATVVDYFKWLYDNGLNGRKNAQKNLTSFFRGYSTDAVNRKRVERLCHQLADDLGVFYSSSDGPV